MLSILEKTFERCSRELREHCSRTGNLIERLLRELDRQDLIELWEYNGRKPYAYHDIGKLFMDGGTIKQHSVTGCKFFEYLYNHALIQEEQIFFSIASDLCHYHHAHYDGSGFPGALAEYDIPLVARVGAVADSWDRCCAEKAQKPASAFAKIEALRGTLFDPEVVDALKSLFPVFRLDRKSFYLYPGSGAPNSAAKNLS